MNKHQSNTLKASFSGLATLCLISICSLQSKAQPGGIETDPIRIISNYRPTLAPPTAVHPQPVQPPIKTETRVLNYTVKDVGDTVPVQVPSIQALRAPTPKPSPLNTGYAKIGLNFPLGGVIDVGLSSGRNKDFRYSANLFHNSNRGTIKTDSVEYRNAYANRTGLSGAIDLSSKQLRFLAKAKVERRGVGLYGVNEAIYGETPDDQSSVSYIIPNLDLLIQRVPKDGQELELEGWLRGGGALNSKKPSEVGFTLGGQASLPIVESQRLAAKYESVVLADQNANLSYTRTFHSFEAGWIYTDEKIRLRAGGEVAYNTGEAKGLKFYPMLDGSYALVEKKHGLWLKIDGGLKSNELANLLTINPFMGRYSILRFTNERISIGGGLEGHLINWLNYRAGVTYTSFENGLFFVGGANEDNVIHPWYDDGTRLRIHAQLNGTVAKKTQVGAELFFDSYNLNNNSDVSPSGLPLWEIKLHGRQQVTESINLGAHIQAFSAVKNIRMTESQRFEQEGKGLIDIGLNGDYKVTDRFKAFFQANNLLNQRYIRFAGYPTFGMQGTLGVNYIF